MVCTRSGDGVTVLSNEGRVDVPVDQVVPVDATGAGDQFAAGFLFGLAQGKDMETCARMGHVAGGEVIGHIGPRPQADVAELMRAKGLLCPNADRRLSQDRAGASGDRGHVP